MFRFTSVVALALCLSPSQSYAQNQRFTVTARSASIYQAPSAASAVIGQSSEGAVLDVRSEVGDWVEVAWPNAAKGIAYVRVSTGWIVKPLPNGVATAVQKPMTINEFVRGTSAAQLPTSLPASGSPTTNRAATAVQRPMTIDEFVHGTSTAQLPTAVSTSGSPNPSAAYVAEAVAAVSTASTPRPNVTASNATYVAPAHFVGLGGRIGALTPSVGGTGRVWSRAGVGVQFEIFRDARTNAATAERVTSLQFAPSVLYALPNAVSDYFWVRPYLGGGATIYRSTLRSTNVAEVGSSSGSSLGLQLFGGGEMTFAGVPRFALSADLGYRKLQTEFARFERRKIGFALSGHWFVR